MVYAAATTDTVLLYDTQHGAPFASLANLHCAALSDMAWSLDGTVLFISSQDGFVSVVSFEPADFQPGATSMADITLDASETKIAEPLADDADADAAAEAADPAVGAPEAPSGTVCEDSTAPSRAAQTGAAAAAVSGPPEPMEV